MLLWILPLLWVYFVEIMCWSPPSVRLDKTMSQYEIKAVKKKLYARYKMKGDILHGNEVVFGKDRDLVWYYGVIPFVFERDYPEGSKQTLREIMSDISNKTCVRFRDYDPDKDLAHLLIINNGTEFCITKLGRPSKKQKYQSIANFPDRCVYNQPMALHEFMHVLGFPDEQQYPGRDTWVSVFLHKIKPEAQRHYLQLHQPNVTIYALPYDYHSVMQMSAKRFSTDHDEPSILPKIHGIELGSPHHNLSFQDVEKINTFYDWECSLRQYKEYLAVQL